jgi:NAD-dependent SIR2 family protein deacetylase
MVIAPRDLSGIARFITSSECSSIIFLTGAGISVSSGIPDFRSPGGMYDTLRPDLITATSCKFVLFHSIILDSIVFAKLSKTI